MNTDPGAHHQTGTSAMRVTLFMTTSLNGIIARPDYREDFLSAENWYSFLACAHQTGAFIWGRKTQEKFQQWNNQYVDQMKDLVKVVVSAHPSFMLEKGFEWASSPTDAISKLKAKGCRRATLAGGSILNSSFAREQLIDEVVLNLEAVMIGRGIPLFSPEDFDLRLEMQSISQVSERIIQLRCKVKK